jgi:hypothetical protein
VLHLDSARKPGLGILILLDRATREEVVARMSEPQVFEAAYVLEPTDDVQQEGSQLSASYLHGDQAGRSVALLGPAGQATVYLIAGPKEEAAYYEQVLHRLAQSTRFVSRETAELLKRWYGHLTGMMLIRTHDEAKGALHEWHLCGDGRFVYRLQTVPEQSEASPQGGYEETGTWRVDMEQAEPRLVVTPDRGLARAYPLQERAGDTYVDGKPFLRGVSDRCL